MTRVFIEVFRLIVVLGGLGSIVLILRGVVEIANSDGVNLRTVIGAGSLFWGLTGVASAGFAATVLHIADRLDQIAARADARADSAPPPPVARVEPRLTGSTRPEE